MPFEVLDLALMFFGRLAGTERPKILAFSRRGVGLSGIEAILSGLELADQRCSFEGKRLRRGAVADFGLAPIMPG